ncbi:MAG: 50S ribosomal protein L4 [Clostridia bacterium]|nr:50S ribosomal protein L4 [Clostridia bacterium]MBR5987696.1 50S ribosomal protein L4 [Clostridia bacterium]
MISVKVYDKSAKEVGNIQVSEEVFGRDFNEALIHQVVVAQLANRRQGTKSALTRTEVRGGGKKPWRQKGTGNARQGSIRAPQWIKGGVVFAPKPRDFSQKVNKTMRRQAIKSALSTKLADGELTVVDSLNLEAAKTREAQAILNNFGFARRTLIVIDGEDQNLLLATRNIPNATLIDCALLNVYDIVASYNLLVTKAAMEAIDKALGEEE